MFRMTHKKYIERKYISKIKEKLVKPPTQLLLSFLPFLGEILNTSPAF